VVTLSAFNDSLNTGPVEFDINLCSTVFHTLEVE
jgi:hypothetical protein